MIRNINLIYKILYAAAAVVIILAGISLRTDIWLNEPGFFGDEGSLIYNIQNRNFLGLFTGLDFAQACPPFFLCIAKIIYNFYGLNETALRFIPYFSGILTLIIIPFLGCKIFKLKSLSLIFLSALIFNFHINYYSQNFKQYSSDVFFTTLILLLFFQLKDKLTAKTNAFFAGIFFALSGFISFPSEFIIFPAFLYFIYKFIKEKNYKNILYISLPYLITLAFQYFFIIKSTMENGILTCSDWNTDTISFYSLPYTEELLNYILSSIVNPHILTVLFFAGIITLLVKERLNAYILITPIILNIISGLLHLYPFAQNRAILYLFPIFYIICLKPFDLLFTKHIKINIFLDFVIIISAGFLFFNLYNNRYLPKYYDDRKASYWYVQSNAREYINKLNTKQVKKSDIIFVDITGEGIITIYDKENKYSRNIIYQSSENPLTVRNENINGKNIEGLDEIPKNSNIYFYNSRYFADGINSLTEIENWIKNNTEIIFEEKEDFGTFLYVKKIK